MAKDDMKILIGITNCHAADAMAECPSFEQWLGFVPNRRQLLDICRSKNVESNKKFAEASKHFKDQHLD